MEKLKCTSCGGNLEVEENKEYAVCDHCGAKYKLNKDLNVNIKLDDDVKEVLNNQIGNMNNSVKFMVVPAIAFFIFILIVFFFTTIKSNEDRRANLERQREMEESMQKQQDKIMEQMEKGKEQINEDMKEIENDGEKEVFNLQFEFDNGTQNAFFVKTTLDEIIRSNNSYDRKVALVINGAETTNESEIVNIKQTLDGNYEVSVKYDEKGYVNKIIIEKIN